MVDINNQAPNHGFQGIAHGPVTVNNGPSPEQQAAERLAQLRLCIRSHKSTIRARLANFVGRKQELEEVLHLIRTIQTTGGYVLITGTAGQGKSSLTAQLVSRHGIDQTIHHFIPIEPGSGYQISLLRDLTARLILKHNLADIVLDTESPSILRDQFWQVIENISDMGIHETIFIDGLDQLLEQPNGLRELSFLPSAPFPGIVFVIGMRPDETLHHLKSRTPQIAYPLPGMSNSDFAALLVRFNVSLADKDISQLATILQHNALYLNLAAQQLAHEGADNFGTLVAQLSQDPEGIFSYAVTKLKQPPEEWQQVIKPVLRVLTVAQEALTVTMLSTLVGADSDRIRDGLQRLGGLLRSDQDRYEIDHRKFRDYLCSSIFTLDEQQAQHRSLANWCEGPNNNSTTIWYGSSATPLIEERRSYARRHYITHLYALREVDRLRQVLDHGEPDLGAGHRVSTVLGQLRNLTATEPERAREIILAILVPLITCESQPGTVLHTVVHECRKELNTWIDQYEDDWRTRIRDAVLDALVSQLRATPHTATCWALLTVGYRRDDVVSALWQVVEQHEDLLGDTALVVLSNLGLVGDQRQHLLDRLHQRIAQRRNHPLIGSLRSLADPQSLATIQQHWLPTHSIDNYLDHLQLIGVLSDIARTHAEDAELANIIRTLMTSGKEYNPIWVRTVIKPLADDSYSTYIVPDLIALLDGFSVEAAANQDSGDIYDSLAKCIAPWQLTSWPVSSPPQALRQIRRDACFDTATSGIWNTSQRRLKNAAWNTALSLAEPSIGGWLDDAINNETNPNVAHDILILASSVRWSELPAIVKLWVTEPYDLVEDDANVGIAPLAAVRLVASLASQEALELLLRCGVTNDGHALRTAVEALSQVATSLARDGDKSVADLLVTTLQYSQLRHQRTSAAEALHQLAKAKLLPLEVVSPLAALLKEDQRDAFERSLIVDTLGLMPVDLLSEEAVQFIYEWAQSSDNELGNSAARVLIQQNLLSAVDEVLIKRLGLTQSDTGWTVAEPASDPWAPLMIALLYIKMPSSYLPAIVDILISASWSAAVQVIAVLCDYAATSGEPLAEPVRGALLTRAQQRQQPAYAEPDLFEAMTTLAPHELAQENWATRWDEWRPETRAALADALGKLVCKDTSLRDSLIQQLEQLCVDLSYGVRRAAFRALERQSPETLIKLVTTWAADQRIIYRCYATEGWSWLPFSATEQAKELYHQLESDTERSIRDRIRSAYSERLQRQWASDYLSYILATGRSQNADVLQIWRYGAALEQIGDDLCAAKLRAELATTTLPPHVHSWYAQLIDAIEKRWSGVTRKWSDSWSNLSGTIEEGEGELVFDNNHRIAVRYTLWRQAVASPRDVTRWGGVLKTLDPLAQVRAQGSDTILPIRFEETEGRLYLKDSRSAHISIDVMIPGAEIKFRGNDYYPESP